MIKDNRWLICPFCGWGKKYKSKKGVAKLNVVSPNSSFIQHRDMSGGRGSGFKSLYMESILDIKDDPEYKNLLLGLKDHCKEILEALDSI